MKGLMLKELYLIKSFAKQYVLFLVLMAAWSIMVHNISFVATYIMVLGSSLILSTTSMDESVSFNRFAVTMPIDGKKIVKSKYTVLFLAVGLGEVLVWLFDRAVNLLADGKMEMIDGEGMIVMVALFLSANAISIPVMFKVGVTKSRYTYIVVMITIGFIILGGYKASEMAGIPIDDMLNGIESMLNLIASVIAVLIVIVSYLISVRIVQKKEW
ncbi:MAG: ABC-2 transporter permease [Lachnospiraceae bacterium]|nr:ABC-2 transporter permease [Lachnospiraceae bacterium]